MVLVKGTNCGFVTTAPTADPNLGNAYGIDNNALAFKDTSPATAGKIVEIGWWCFTATEESNFEGGIYSHNSGDDLPGDLLDGVSRTNAKGTTTGWKRATGLNIPISSNTIYWLGLQLDDTATLTSIGADPAVGVKYSFKTSQTTLPSSWSQTYGGTKYNMAIYAVWEAGAPAGTNIQVNISDGLNTFITEYFGCWILSGFFIFSIIEILKHIG